MSKDIKETENFITIENIKVPIEGEKNLLVLIRKANIEIPTFCYHSNLSTYGACRLCLVDIEGMGIQASCSIKPKVGMKVKVHTAQIREMRRVNVELLLASGYHECTTCSKNTFCKLQSLARQLGIKEIRFKKTEKKSPRDLSSDAIVRDPSKCILCGDCIRMCEEVQAVGAIDFAFRGSDTEVVPSLNKNLKDVECVYCGQCTRVCPTGALSPKSEVSKIWADLHDKKRKVAVQIAPAVRVAIGEKYDLAPGKSTTGLIVTALKMLGFDYVYDSSFSADLTIVEEANEFLDRFTKNKNMPQYTSCCPAWIRFVEQFYPELNKNLSTCKSPQQMLGALVKEDFVRKGGKRKDISMISVMPCSAKKHEAKREEFSKEQYADVDHVITTVGVSRMIDEMGIDFRNLKPSSFDLPFGFKTGAGVLFGASGGVTEAVIRYVAEKLALKEDDIDCTALRTIDGVKEINLKVGKKEVKIAAVSGLKNAKDLIEDLKSGKRHYDFIEVMACPGGCVGGAGQPVYSKVKHRQKRAEGLYKADVTLELHKSQENHYVKKVYEELGCKVGKGLAHELFHTHYTDRKKHK